MVTKTPSNSNRGMPKTTRPKASSAAARSRMLATRRRDTAAEVALRSALRKLGVRYRIDVRLPGTRRRADLAFSLKKVAVFVDGCFWHGCPEHRTWPKANAEWWRSKLVANVTRDRHTDRALREMGWLVLRFWEHEPASEAAQRIVVALRGRRKV